MDKKLTLMLDKRVINQAKAYAKRQHKSLSGMVENYFKNLTGSGSQGVQEMTPLVEELSGILKVKAGFDRKADYLRHLEDKHT